MIMSKCWNRLAGIFLLLSILGALDGSVLTDLMLADDEVGRVDAIENMIFPDSDVLKAITFSVSYKDPKWVEVLEDLLEQMDEFIAGIKNKETLKNAQYYRYCINNVKKYTIKWLGEEVQNLILDLNEKKDDVELLIKRNIAEFLYYSASDHGVDLTVDNKDLTLNSWTKKSKSKPKTTNDEKNSPPVNLVVETEQPAVEKEESASSGPEIESTDDSHRHPDEL